MQLESWIVDNLWAIAIVILPFLIFSSEFWINSSVSESIFAVASSSINIFGLLAIVLANVSSCLSPLEKVAPLSVTILSYLSSSLSIKLCASTNLAASITSSLVNSSLYILILDSTVPWYKNGSWRTSPTLFLNSLEL